MGVEIERKFLVGDPSIVDGVAGTVYRQGYLSRDPERTVRVRIAGDRVFLTVKGVARGATRAEFEYRIPLADAEALLALCDGPAIEKTRFRIPDGGHVWEVDVFEGANAGLVVAEVELTSEEDEVALPSWVGAEVTGDERYVNASLVERPYGSWAG